MKRIVLLVLAVSLAAVPTVAAQKSPSFRALVGRARNPRLWRSLDLPSSIGCDATVASVALGCADAYLRGEGR
jgi:Ni/Co efflux regulator RcnB